MADQRPAMSSCDDCSQSKKTMRSITFHACENPECNLASVKQQRGFDPLEWARLCFCSRCLVNTYKRPPPCEYTLGGRNPVIENQGSTEKFICPRCCGLSRPLGRGPKKPTKVTRVPMEAVGRRVEEHLHEQLAAPLAPVAGLTGLQSSPENDSRTSMSAGHSIQPPPPTEQPSQLPAPAEQAAQPLRDIPSAAERAAVGSEHSTAGKRPTPVSTATSASSFDMRKDPTAAPPSTREAPRNDADLASAVSEMMRQIDAQPHVSERHRGPEFMRMKEIVWAQLVSEGWREEENCKDGNCFFPPGCTRHNTIAWNTGVGDGRAVRFENFQHVVRFASRVISNAARRAAVGSEHSTAAKHPTPGTAKPARRGTRRGADTLAQREVAARVAVVATFNRTRGDRVGTVFDTCHVGAVACTAIQMSTRHRLALVERCSDAILGDIARRNSGWAAELGDSAQQIFLVAEGEAKSTVVFSRRKDSQALVIHLFGTAEPCQRQGYGTALLRMLQKYVNGAEIFVEVATENIPAWWLSKAFLGTATKFSEPRLWNTTALLRWCTDTEALCFIGKRQLCPFRNCSFKSPRASDVQDHIQRMHAPLNGKQIHPRSTASWQQPTSFKGEHGASDPRPSTGHGKKRPVSVISAAASAIKQPESKIRRRYAIEITPEQSGNEEGDKKTTTTTMTTTKKKKADQQEQKWVRKIIALAQQTDKSGLSAKAKTLFRMMKADLRNDASSSEEEEDSDDDSSESEDSYSDDDETFENAVIRVGKEYQCTGIPPFPGLQMPPQSDCVADGRAGNVVWDPTRIPAPELRSYLAKLRISDTNDAGEEEFLVDPWPNELGPKPQVQEQDKDPCGVLKRGALPSEHSNIKPPPVYPIRMDSGLHHLAECNYNVEQASLGLEDLIMSSREVDTKKADHLNLMIEGIKTYGKDFAKVCSAINDVGKAVFCSAYKPVTVAHITEFYYSKWRNTNDCEQWRRSAQYRATKQQIHRQEQSVRRNCISATRLLSGGDVHTGTGKESDSKSQNESEKELKHKPMTAERQAAMRKAELEAKRALQRSLRESPPNIHTTGTVDPRVDGKLPNELIRNSPEISQRPTVQELGTWTRDSLAAYWKARWCAWERESLRSLQRACSRRLLAQNGDKFDLVLRLARFDMGGGTTALLHLDDLIGMLHQTAADELWALEQMPSTATGEVIMTGGAGGLLESAKQLPLLTAEVLRTWTLESQREFWLWRWREWAQRPLVECQSACAACVPPLWAGSNVGKTVRTVRARLCMHEFAPDLLGARDFAEFYELEGQYLDVQFDDRTWWFGQVVEQHSTSLHLQWIDGQSDWVNDIVQRSEYRVVESPKTETIIELVIAQLITNVEQIEERTQAETGVKIQERAQEKSANQTIPAPSYLADLLSKSGTINTRVLVAVALASNGKIECARVDDRNGAAGNTYVALDNETPNLDVNKVVAINKKLCLDHVQPAGEKNQGEWFSKEDHVRAVVVELVELIAGNEGDGADELDEETDPPSNATDLCVRESSAGSSASAEAAYGSRGRRGSDKKPKLSSYMVPVELRDEPDGCSGTVAFRRSEQVNCPGCKVLLQAPRAAYALRCSNCKMEIRPATLVTPKDLEQAAEEQSGPGDADDDEGSQTVTKTFWTHSAGPLLDELVSCIEALQNRHEELIMNQAESGGRTALRNRVRNHLKAYERTHPKLFVCTEFNYGTRRRLSAKALRDGRDMGFSSKFFRSFRDRADKTLSRSVGRELLMKPVELKRPPKAAGAQKRKRHTRLSERVDRGSLVKYLNEQDADILIEAESEEGEANPVGATEKLNAKQVHSAGIDFEVAHNELGYFEPSFPATYFDDDGDERRHDGQKFVLASVLEAEREAERIKDEVRMVLHGVCKRVEREQLQMDVHVAYTKYKTMLAPGNQ